MVNENFDNQLSKSLRLINYRRDLILSEQILLPSSFGKNAKLEDLQSVDLHSIIDIAALITAFVPGGLLLSGGLEVLNAALYAAKGDEYEAGIRVLFALIPGVELALKIPGIKKYGKEGVIKILQKAKKTGKLSGDELQVYRDFKNSSKWLKLNAARKAVSLSIKTIIRNPKVTLKQLVELVLRLNKVIPTLFNITTMGLYIGGVIYYYDELAHILGLNKTYSVPTPKRTQVVKTKKEKINNQFESEKTKVQAQVEKQVVPKIMEMTEEEQYVMVSKELEGLSFE
jgi:hypothetical protein